MKTTQIHIIIHTILGLTARGFTIVRTGSGLPSFIGMKTIFLNIGLETLVRGSKLFSTNTDARKSKGYHSRRG